MQKLSKQRAGRVGIVAVIISALALLMTALPGLAAKPPAPEKIFSLDITPVVAGDTNLGETVSGPAITGVAKTFTATVTNRTPGNSNFSSYRITVPDDFSSVTASGTGVTVSGNDVTVVVGTSVKEGQSSSVQITAVAASDLDPCSTEVTYSALWSAVAWTGSPGSTTFRQLSEDLEFENSLNAGVDQESEISHNLSTQIRAACLSMDFGTQPTDASTGDVITGVALDPESSTRVTVEFLTAGTVDVTRDSGTVTLSVASSPTGAQYVLTGNTAVFQDGVATFQNLKISDGATAQAAGAYTLTASYDTYSATSDSFTIYDDLICPDLTQPDAEYSESNGASSIELQSTDDDCFGITVEDTTATFGAKRQDTWSVTKSGTTLFQGYLTFTWDLSNTDPIAWTQVIWDGLSAYKDVELCNFGVDYTLPASYDSGDLFPAGEEMCLAAQSLNIDTGVQTEVIAYNTDLGTRKVF